MKKYLVVAVSLILFNHYANAQRETRTISRKPKLIIGLVIDQMRWDYLYRFNTLYGNGGFKRLLSEGFSCENTLIPYVPTYTAPGHSCIYTGSVPAIHGIVGNNWYDKTQHKNVYCTDDSTVSTVGSSTNGGKMSPENLWTTTITDELKFSNNFKSKVIGIALKDRASILPAGHAADAAYWYDDQAGTWITSTYYMKTLPPWVHQLNEKHFPDSAMKQDWNTSLPANKYDQSAGDDNPYEQNIIGEETKAFPHKLSSITTRKYEAFKFTPSSIVYTFDMAKAAIQHERLGQNNVTDFLTVSVSSTDYIGHWFGPNSVELEDTYLKLDKQIADMLDFLDRAEGKGNYLLFLTADHGVAHIPAFLKQHGVPAGVFNEEVLSKELSNMLMQKYHVQNIIRAILNYQVYLNDSVLLSTTRSTDIRNSILQYLKTKPYIIQAFETEQIASSSLPEPLKKMILNGYNPKRSGDIQFTIKPAYFVGGETGTTHGSWNPYDAHIPLVWFGWNIRNGLTHRETYMTDISPTLAALMNIQMPNGSVGKVIEELF